MFSILEAGQPAQAAARCDSHGAIQESLLFRPDVRHSGRLWQPEVP
jgi:hypothetical protein